jgi:hypothetical protein
MLDRFWGVFSRRSPLLYEKREVEIIVSTYPKAESQIGPRFEDILEYSNGNPLEFVFQSSEFSKTPPRYLRAERTGMKFWPERGSTVSFDL